MITTTTVLTPQSYEDQARADCYALLGALFIAPPDADLLGIVAHAEDWIQGESALAVSWARLQQASSAMEADAAGEEFKALFVGVGETPCTPYSSYHQTGWMMDTPVAQLRSDLQRLGLARRADNRESEDHLATLCEIMRYLIQQDGGRGASLQDQRKIFSDYIQPMYKPCFAEIRAAAGVNYYRRVADFGEAFFDIEAKTFESL